MLIEATSHPDVIMLIPRRIADQRGWLTETRNAVRMAEAGLDMAWVQDNHTYCRARGTLRGLHFQTPPHTQAKLVRCSRGAILDVAMDIREGSARYASWVAVELSSETGRQMLVPEGFMHGFVSLTDDAEVQYKCSARHAPDHDRAVRWDYPALGIDGGLSVPPVLSPKDATAPLLQDIGTPFPRLATP